MAASASKIRVLIVDDIAETRENIRKLLQFEPDFDVVAMARTGQEGVQLSREHKPNVVLMDINMPDMDGIRATELIVKDVPTAQIVMVSVQSDTDYMRRAMMAGARDFLPKPPPADELISTIRRLGEMSLQREQQLAAVAAMPVSATPGYRPGGGADGKVIAVYSPKGGVGCTSIAVNLAIALHSEEHKVVVVDANLQFGDVGVFYNLQGKYNIISLAERVDEMDPEFVQSVLVTHASGVKVLLAPPSPEDAELVNAGQLKKLLDHLRDYFAYIIVDTSSALRDVELSIFDVADRVLLVVTPDIPAVKDATRFFELTDKLDYPKEKTMMVMNRVDKRPGGLSVASIEENLKHTACVQIALDDRLVLKSINDGVPFVNPANRAAPVVQNILELAQKVRKEFAPKEAAVEDKKRPVARPVR